MALEGYKLTLLFVIIRGKRNYPVFDTSSVIKTQKPIVYKGF